VPKRLDRHRWPMDLPGLVRRAVQPISRTDS
jgi:hypothetical protein